MITQHVLRWVVLKKYCYLHIMLSSVVKNDLYMIIKTIDCIDLNYNHWYLIVNKHDSGLIYSVN